MVNIRGNKHIWNKKEIAKSVIKEIPKTEPTEEKTNNDDSYEENPFKNIRKYISLNGEYTCTVIAFPKKNSGILVQLDNSNVTCLVRVPARFNFFTHFKDKVLIKVTEIKEDKKFIYGYLMRIV